MRLRRALLLDDPRGSQAKAQERAREAIDTRSPLTPAWWRFESMTILDCVLITPELVVTVEAAGDQPPGPATEWYPKRSTLVRTLEAARELAQDKQFAALLLSEQPLEYGTAEHLARALPREAPHLDAAGHRELQDAYLGNLSYEAALEAVGLPAEILAHHAGAVT